jgi:hypothetical protein
MLVSVQAMNETVLMAAKPLLALLVWPVQVVYQRRAIAVHCPKKRIKISESFREGADAT